MNLVISKSQFKPRVLEYLRLVERAKKTVLVTHAGKPVVQVIPYKKASPSQLKALRHTVIEYKSPTQPVGETEWETLT